MATIVHGGGAEDEIFDGYTLFMCLIGSKWGSANGDGSATRRLRLYGIDMTRVKSINVSMPNTTGYDYFRVMTTTSEDNLFFRQSAGTFDVDFGSMDADKKKSMIIEVYNGGTTYLTINSVTKAE